MTSDRQSLRMNETLWRQDGKNKNFVTVIARSLFAPLSGTGWNRSAKRPSGLQFKRIVGRCRPFLGEQNEHIFVERIFAWLQRR